MNLTIPLLRSKLEQHLVLRTIVASLAAFGTYASMYAFRKGFAAGSYSNGQWAGMDYKVWLVLAQVFGYMISKFAGIRIVSELRKGSRARSIFLFIGISWGALLLFAVVPPPFHIACLFLNGLPLGMIWGIVFSYLEGRRTTELMGTVMAVSLIFSSGLAKTTGKWLMLSGKVSEHWMPFMVGLTFVLPLVLCVFLLEQLPPPDASDIASRAERHPMTQRDRRRFVRSYLPGIILIVLLYLSLTVIRDMRDNFEVEIWTQLGFGGQPAIFTQTDAPIAVSVLFLMSLLMLVRNNLGAFTLIHLAVLLGCLTAGFSTWLFDLHLIGPVTWMSISGFGLYMAYIPFNCIFFERMIATFRITGNVGFIMYIADSFGYLGTVSLLLVKQLAGSRVSWLSLFHSGILFVSVSGSFLIILSLCYFRLRYNRSRVLATNLNGIYA